MTRKRHRRRWTVRDIFISDVLKQNRGGEDRDPNKDRRRRRRRQITIIVGQG